MSGIPGWSCVSLPGHQQWLVRVQGSDSLPDTPSWYPSLPSLTGASSQQTSWDHLPEKVLAPPYAATLSPVSRDPVRVLLGS